MNLYRVSDTDYTWCCYIFETSRNRAKLAVSKEFDFDYIDARCKTLAKNVGEIKEPVLIYDEECDGYEVVTRLGYRYAQEETE